MPPPFPTSHRGMTANPQRPARYRPGKPIAEEPSSEEEEEEEVDEEIQREQERKRLEQQRQKKVAPRATSFPGTSTVTKDVKDAKIQQEDDDDEEGFVTEEEDEGTAPAPAASARDTVAARVAKPTEKEEEEDEEDEEEESEQEESSEEESSSEDEAPRRVLLRPTFIKKDKRANGPTDHQGAAAADSIAEAEARKAQRQEKADALVREQIEKDAIARSSANKAWDDDEAMANEEAAIDDTDGKDPEAEYAAWKLRELKRIKREREAIEAAEKEREEVERRRNLTAEEREREDQEFLAKQKEEREASRGQTGYMQRYFHKGAFFRPDLEKEGLDKRNVMGARFADDVARETLPQYMQIRDMTKLGKKGRTRYKDLRTEDTGRFGEGFDNRRRQEAPVGVTDERFLPDRGFDKKGPTGANASVVRERRRSRSSSRSRSRSPRRDRKDDGRDSRDRSGDRYRPDTSSRRKRSPSPYEDRDKRRRMRSVS